jgi:hypothetical protein
VVRIEVIFYFFVARQAEANPLGGRCHLLFGRPE